MVRCAGVRVGERRRVEAGRGGGDVPEDAPADGELRQELGIAPGKTVVLYAGRFSRLKGVGHLPNVEAPDVFDAAVLDFLRAALAPAAA